MKNSIIDGLLNGQKTVNVSSTSNIADMLDTFKRCQVHTIENTVGTSDISVIGNNDSLRCPVLPGLRGYFDSNITKPRHNKWKNLAFSSVDATLNNFTNTTNHDNGISISGGAWIDFNQCVSETEEYSFTVVVSQESTGIILDAHREYDEGSWIRRNTPTEWFLGAGSVYRAPVPTTGIVNEVTVVKTKENFKFYLNGEIKLTLDGTKAVPTKPETTTRTGAVPEEFMTGKLYTVLLYSRALSNKEVMENHWFLSKCEKGRDTLLSDSVEVISGENEELDPSTFLIYKNGRLKYKHSNGIKLRIAYNKSLEECIVEETDDYIIYSDGNKTAEDPIPEGICFACRVDKHTGEIGVLPSYSNYFSKVCIMTEDIGYVKNNVYDFNDPDHTFKFSPEGFRFGDIHSGPISFIRSNSVNYFSMEILENKLSFPLAFRLLPQTPHIEPKQTGFVESDMNFSSQNNDLFRIWWYFDPHSIIRSGETITLSKIFISVDKYPYVRTKCPKTKIEFDIGNDGIENVSINLKHIHQLQVKANESDNEVMYQRYMVMSTLKPTYDNISNSFVNWDSESNYIDPANKGIRSEKYIDLLWSSSYKKIVSSINSDVTGDLKTTSSRPIIKYVSLSYDQLKNVRSFKSVSFFNENFGEVDLKNRLLNFSSVTSRLSLSQISNSILGLENLYSNTEEEYVDGVYVFNTDLPDSRLSFYLGLDPITKHIVVYNNSNDPASLEINENKSLEECIVEETDDYIIYSDAGGPVNGVYKNFIKFGAVVDKIAGTIYALNGTIERIPISMYPEVTGVDLFLDEDNKNYYFRVTDFDDPSFIMTALNGSEFLLNINGYLKTLSMDFIDENNIWNQFRCIYRDSSNRVHTIDIPRTHDVVNFYSFPNIDITKPMILSPRIGGDRHIEVGKDYNIKNIMLSCGFGAPKSYIKGSGSCRIAIKADQISEETHTYMAKGIKGFTSPKQNTIFFSRRNGIKNNVFCSNELIRMKPYFDICANVNTGGIFFNDEFSKVNLVDVMEPGERTKAIEFGYVGPDWSASHFKEIRFYKGLLTEDEMRVERNKTLAFFNGKFISNKIVRSTGNTDDTTSYTIEEDFHNIGSGYISKIDKTTEKHIPIEVTASVNPRFNEKILNPTEKGVYYVTRGKGGMFGINRTHKVGTRDKNVYTRLVYLP